MPTCDIGKGDKTSDFVPLELCKPPPQRVFVPTQTCGQAFTKSPSAPLQCVVTNICTNPNSVVDVGKDMFIDEKPVETLSKSVLISKLQKVIYEKNSPTLNSSRKKLIWIHWFDTFCIQLVLSAEVIKTILNIMAYG